MADVWFYEKDGRFLASDKHNLVIVAFPDAAAREKWAEGLTVHQGFPDIFESLAEGLDVDRSPAAKEEFCERWNIHTKP